MHAVHPARLWTLLLSGISEFRCRTEIARPLLARTYLHKIIRSFTFNRIRRSHTSF